MLQGERIKLVKFRDSDADILFRWINDPDLVRWHAPFRPIPYEEHMAWFRDAQGSRHKVAFGIREIVSDALIGVVQLVDIHLIHKSAELRIKICEPGCREKGYGSEALKLILDFAWRTLDLHRVKIETFANNERALRTFAHMGFREEGRLKKAACIEGQWEDVIVMGILREECMAGQERWREFTEDGYKALLRLAVSQDYHFALFTEKVGQRHVLWRHDIDLSVHRAARLAEIEAEMGARATYFVNPHCSFYNMLEPDILRRLKRIQALGHAIGLHFDADAYPGEVWTRDKLEKRLRQERTLVQETLGCPVEAFSYHNPDIGGLMDFDEDRLADMVNVYSKRLRADYVYVSDSNGYWRFKPIPDVIREGHERLHILTHPEWWTPEPMAPRDRVERCAMGRAQATLRRYDEDLSRFGRSNIGKVRSQIPDP